MYEGIDRKKLIGMNTIQLQDLNVMYSANSASLMIESLIMYLNMFLNVKDENKLHDWHIQELGRQLYRTFKAITIGEVWLFFDSVLKGDFGQFFNCIDPIQLNRWAHEYMIQRGQLIIKDDSLMTFIRNREWDSSNQINLECDGRHR